MHGKEVSHNPPSHLLPRQQAHAAASTSPPSNSTHSTLHCMTAASITHSHQQYNSSINSSAPCGTHATTFAHNPTAASSRCVHSFHTSGHLSVCMPPTLLPQRGHGSIPWAKGRTTTLVYAQWSYAVGDCAPVALEVLLARLASERLCGRRGEGPDTFLYFQQIWL
jgi:hypothetical protein